MLLSISTARGRTETKEYFELINFNIKLPLRDIYYGKRITREPLFSLNRNAITNRFPTPFIYGITYCDLKYIPSGNVLFSTLIIFIRKLALPFWQEKELESIIGKGYL